MEWTEKQKEAIETRGKNVLVAAAAGSGKTTVLTERIIRHVLDDDDFDLSKLLVVTFTRAAAAEMRQRLEKKIADNISLLEKEIAEGGDKKAEARLLRLKRQLLLLDNADISTIHSFCQSVIRREGADENSVIDAGSRIAGEEELQLLRQEIIEEVFLKNYEEPSEDFLRFVSMYGDDKGDDSLYELILNLSDFAESEPDPEYWLNSLIDDYTGVTPELINAGTGGSDGSAKAGQWMLCLRKNTGRILTEIREEIEECIARAESIATDKSQSYADFVQEEYSAVLSDEYKRLVDDIDNRTWDEIRDYVLGINPIVFNKKGSPSRAPGFTGDGESKAEIDAIKALRGEAADKLKKVLQGNWLKKDSRTIADEMALMGGYVKTLAGLAVEFRQRYGQEKLDRHIMDFGDLEHLALDIIAVRNGKGGYGELTEAGKRIRDRYREIMVDEYQDVNHLQETIFTLLSRPEQEHDDGAENDAPCRFIVGDVKQSIYRFRHADPNLFNKKKDVYGQSEEDGPNHRIDMSDNYRSRSSVLKAINYIFKQFMVGGSTEIIYDDREALHFTADSASDNGYPVAEGAEFLDDKTELAIIETDVEEHEEQEEETGNASGKKTAFEYEAAFIARRIEELLSSNAHIWPDKSGDGHRAVEPKDIVVLLRSISGKAEILREQLKSKNIRTYVTVDAGYFEALEVNTVVSLMRIIDNAHQDIPLAAVLRSPIGMFTDEELVKLRLFDRQERYFYDILKSAADYAADGGDFEQYRPEYLDEGLQEKVRGFLTKMAGWRNDAREMSLGELIWKLLRETDYYEYVGAMPGGQLRQANLRLLIERARAYESEDNHGLFRFLHFIGLLKKGKTDLSQARTLGENENVVRIMTIHKSKGMEFPVVILAGMGTKFNTRDENRTFIYHKELGIGGDIIATERQLSGGDTGNDLLRMKKTAISKEAIKYALNREMKAEELRLLYVALTRAKEKLIMTGSVKDFDKAAAAWRKYNKTVLSANDKKNVMPFDDSDVMEAKTMLDWVAAAAANHIDGTLLHPDDAPGMFYDDGSHFKLEVVRAASDDCDNKNEDSKSETADADGTLISGNEFLTAVVNRQLSLKGKTLTDDAELLAKEIEDLLQYEYPDCGTAGLSAKISVTELKHRSQLEEQRASRDSAVPQGGGAEKELVEEEIKFRESALLSNAGTAGENEESLSEVYIGGPLFGTAVHEILQQVVQRNIKKGSEELSKVVEEIITAVMGSNNKSLLNRYMRKAQKYVNGFLEAEIGRRVMAAGALGKTHCELPFIRLLNLEQVFPDKFKVGEGASSNLPKIFLQGIIDLLFEEDGRYILLDYKTDRNIDGTAAKQRYHKQLELYMESIENLTGKKVDEAYLFLLDKGEAVRM
ncbi:MAG: helicase-exonuclease AddAB subunit AddA [Selenomonadaceae bacterium]|nr:helicase-exonuclease AddAB subunit AddA [Selenomonadaceae bacterium]